MPAYLFAFGSKADVSLTLPDIAIYEYASPRLGSGPEAQQMWAPRAHAPQVRILTSEDTILERPARWQGSGPMRFYTE
jgi:hypothetical protein